MSPHKFVDDKSNTNHFSNLMRLSRSSCLTAISFPVLSQSMLTEGSRSETALKVEFLVTRQTSGKVISVIQKILE